MNSPIIEKGRTALVFIEFQAEWLAEEGKLFRNLIQDKGAFRQAVDVAGQVLATARRAGWTIVHAGLDFRADPSYRLFAGGEGMLGLRAAVPRAGTWQERGGAFVPPFVPRPGEFEVRGRSGASVLKNSNLDAFLRNNRIDSLVLLGWATHVCVESTLREAHDMGFNTWVVTDGCAAFRTVQHVHFLEHVLHHFGAGVDGAALMERMERETR